MPAEATCWRELAELVAYHVFGDIDRDERVNVMARESVADKCGGDLGGTAPGLDDRLLARFLHVGDFLFELNGNEWAFFK